MYRFYAQSLTHTHTQTKLKEMKSPFRVLVNQWLNSVEATTGQGWMKRGSREGVWEEEGRRKKIIAKKRRRQGNR